MSVLGKRATEKMDAQAVFDGLAQGLSKADIARNANVSASTITRFLDRMKPYLTTVDQLHRTRADHLAVIHGKSLDVQERVISEILRRIDDKDVLEAMTPTILLNILKGVGQNASYVHDRLRLERGETTSNLGLVGAVTHFHDEVGYFDPDTGKVRPGIARSAPDKTIIEANAKVEIDANPQKEREITEKE